MPVLSFQVRRCAILILGVAFLVACSSQSQSVMVTAEAQTPPVGPMSYPVDQPKIFFSDLESGPNTGGENNAGAFVTIYGVGFGAQQGDSSVTIGAGKAAKYPIWTDTKIAMQLGSAASTGEIKVTRGGKVSNALPFKVRAGRIFFIGPNGKDGGSGAFNSPWKNFTKSRDSMKDGDITYALDGASQGGEDQYGGRATMSIGAKYCSANAEPRAMVGYPGAKATLGSIDGPDMGVRNLNISDLGGECDGGWIFANLQLRAKEAALAIGGGKGIWRVVGNDISCPNGDGQSGCVETGGVEGRMIFYGNHVHDAGKTGASALYHGVYFGTDTNHIDMGWNIVENVKGCRGVQIHSSPPTADEKDLRGLNQYDILIHDNIIHDTQCDGIVMATLNPSKGKVEVFNNVIYNAGKGPNNPEGSGNWACVYVSADTNRGPEGTGTVDIYNNTFYHCGTFSKPPWDHARAAVMHGGHSKKLFIRLRNNIMVQPGGIAYIEAGPSEVNGSNNLFFGNGAAPGLGLGASISKDPQFVNPARGDFHLMPTSPAKGAGVEKQDLGALPFVTPVAATP